MEHMSLTEAPTATAPDGSQVHVLLGLDGLSTARFEFPAHSVSVAVRHRTVSEVWYFLSGSGRFWTDTGPDQGVAVQQGTTVSIEPGECFQLRVMGDEPLVAFGVTSPAWPGDGEASLVSGPWTPTLEAGVN